MSKKEQGVNMPSLSEEMRTARFIEDSLREQGLLPSGVTVASAEAKEMESRGFVGKMARIAVEYAGAEGEAAEKLPAVLYLKSIAPNGGPDGPREATFYRTLSKHGYTHAVPVIAARCADDQEAAILMPDLLSDQQRYTNANLLYGNQIWGMPEDAKLPDPSPSHFETLKDTFLAAADLHAKHWVSGATMPFESEAEIEKLFDLPPGSHSWLKNVDFLCGRQAAKDNYARALARAKSSWAGRTKDAGYPDRIVTIVDRSLAASSAEAAAEELNRSKLWSLCHGDWHAANLFWKPGSVVACDWSQVGVWNPLADLAQHIISDVPPASFVKDCDALVRAYYEALQQQCRGRELGASYEEVWRCFVHHGAARWVYYVALLGGFGLPDKAMVFFSKQLLAFIDAFAPDADAFPLVMVAAVY
ncbi:hypothetical protein DIPPA_20597 [Diplonema papillatum]|nr:hypothetical protein DIPPA_20597 [Diplonema papillatum]